MTKPHAMNGEVVLNISCQSQGGQEKTRSKNRRIIESISSHKNVQPNTDESAHLYTCESQYKRKASKTSKFSLGNQKPALKSPKKIPNSERTLKFAHVADKISTNPLQVGLSAKQHPSQEEFLNTVKEPVNAFIEPLFSKTSWKEFGEKIGLHPHLVSTLVNHFNLKKPTLIQTSAIKPLCDGCDALIKAQTGSGKTFSYAVPLLNHLMNLEPPITRGDGPRAVVLLPTRELASQTAEVFVQLTKACIRIVSGCLIGGTKRKSQKASLRKGLNIIISTPQRLLDHLGKTSSLTLKGVQWLVIDEADRLVELGFERDVRRVIERVAREVSAVDRSVPVQTVLLSATLTPGVENLAGLALRNPVRCEVGEQSSLQPDTLKTNSPSQDSIMAPHAAFAMPSGLKHFLLVCPCKLRLVILAAFLLLKARYNKRSGKIIVFFATQDCVDFHYRLFGETLCDTNDDMHSPVLASNLNLFRLHGNMDHNDRYPVFRAFSNCPNGILLTTDVASRGLDLAGVAWVIQYHVSGTPVDYVHRVGRTARAGGRGKALLMLLPEEETYVSMLRSTVGIELRKLEVTDVLQTALFHVNNSAKMANKKASVTTVEDAAASLSRHLLTTVSQNSELQALAEKAYLSFLRAYASFSGPMRAHFTFRRLHLGHVARAFCLQEAPSDIAAKVTGRRSASGHTGNAPGQRRRQPRLTSASSPPPPAQKSRRLDFDADPANQPARAPRHKPAEMATRNMLAEYGL
uniref:ATP-dependent RNA helicase n=1 Tax=Schistocephalus solidus TaxID=70667 RepID=A0A0X3PVN4_SCHSO